jgi:alpha-beta hydrolase superfamily lysophospholipase
VKILKAMLRRTDLGEYTSEAWLRQHFEEISARRGRPDYFDRFESASVVSDGLALHVDLIEVDGKRPTLVFMPGTNAYAMLYGDLLTALADRGYNIVGFDPRGHGRSEGARGSYTLGELVSDMHAVVSHARERFGDPIVAAGSSQGGITAFYLAAAGAPLAGIICHNAADLSDPDSARLTRFPRLGRLLKPVLAPLARVFPELPVPMTAYLDLEREPVRNLGSARDVLYWDPLLVPFVRLKTLASLGAEPLVRPVEEIDVPVLLLQAEMDTIFPTDYIEKIHARLTCEKSLKVYPGLPHYMIVDHVDRILDDVVEWMERVCSTGAARAPSSPGALGA